MHPISQRCNLRCVVFSCTKREFVLHLLTSLGYHECRPGSKKVPTFQSWFLRAPYPPRPRRGRPQTRSSFTCRARHNNSQLQDRHPTTRVASNCKSSTQLPEFHQMRTQSQNPSVFKIGLAEGQTEKIQDRHPTTRVPSNYKSSNPTT